MTDPVTAPEHLLSRANEALSNADWDAARRLFSQALERGETPEALEGLAKAAFFLDETELALDARERAYAGYREADRTIDAARVAIALAWDYRAVRGERAVSDGWLARARRLLEGRGRTPERGWLACGGRSPRSCAPTRCAGRPGTPKAAHTRPRAASTRRARRSRTRFSCS